MAHHAHARVPAGFREAVETAQNLGARGDLRLLAYEAASLDWQQEGLQLIGDAQARLSRTPEPGAVRGEPPARVVLFTGHMVDAADRPKEKARFPRTAQAQTRARAMIKAAVERELQGHAAGSFLGIAGGACGGDILFHEACAELDAKSDVYLLMPPEPFETASVQPGGADWVARYRALLARSTPRVLQPSADLPGWLAHKPDYNAWERNNLWMMFNAMATGTPELGLIALFNREREASGPGGTGHLVAEAARRGFRSVELDARELLVA